MGLATPRKVPLEVWQSGQKYLDGGRTHIHRSPPFVEVPVVVCLLCRSSQSVVIAPAQANLHQPLSRAVACNFHPFDFATDGVLASLPSGHRQRRGD